MTPEVDRQNVREAVRGYILEEFLPGEDPDALTDSTPLISGGILDSIANAKLVTFLEDHFDVRFKSSEISPDHLDTVDRIVDTVLGKQKG